MFTKEQLFKNCKYRMNLQCYPELQKKQMFYFVLIAYMNALLLINMNDSVKIFWIALYFLKFLKI